MPGRPSDARPREQCGKTLGGAAGVFAAVEQGALVGTDLAPDPRQHLVLRKNGSVSEGRGRAVHRPGS